MTNWQPFRGKPRVALEKLRKTIKAAAPQATETISFQMPAFKDRGRFLVSHAAFKDHCSLFPASEAVMAALADELKLTSRGRRRSGSPWTSRSRPHS